MAKLHVQLPDGSPAARFQFFNDPANFLQVSESSGQRLDFSRLGGASLAFRSSADGSTFSERMRLTSDGNLGIGTASPGARLDVAGDAQVQGNAVLAPGSGQVGVGTSTPAAKLHVQMPNGNPAARFTFFNDAANFLQVSESSGQRLDFGRLGSASLTFRSTTDAVTFMDRLRLQSDGKVFLGQNGGDLGIGVNDTGSRLQVNGNVAIGFGSGPTGAPTNGLSIQGAVGIGVALPASGAMLEVSGGAVRVGGRNAINAGGQCLYA